MAKVTCDAPNNPLKYAIRREHKGEHELNDKCENPAYVLDLTEEDIKLMVVIVGEHPLDKLKPLDNPLAKQMVDLIERCKTVHGQPLTTINYVKP